MNQIIIKNLKIYAFHGVHEFEQTDGQNFFIDAIINLPYLSGYDTDDLNDTISYSNVIRTIKNSVQKESYNLIEKVAQCICNDLFSSFKDIISIDVTVKKPEAPINEEFDYVAVRISRERNKI